ncbi:MAG: hypothetical protein ABSC23_08090 [Bryobacteraceae bacterium]|jgi:hypothetical protein
MAGNEAPRDEHRDSNPPETGHEERDVNFRAVGKLAGIMVVLCVASAAIVWGVFRYFEARENGRQAPSEGNAVQANRLPPEPRLEQTPVADLKQIRDSEDQILGTYGWVDRQKGIVRLPIDRAIDLLAQRGLPARQESEPLSAAADVSVPTESGLGPKMIAPGGPLAGEPK